MKINLSSEANTVAEFCYHAKHLGLTFALEVRTPVGRLDIVILNAQQTHFLAIVEAKRDHKYQYTAFAPKIKQCARYELIGVPVEPLLLFRDAEPLAHRLKQRLPFLKGVSISDVMRVQSPNRSPNRKPRYRSKLRQIMTSKRGQQFLASFT